MKALLILMCLLSLSACRSRDYAQADNRVLWDKDGCAYHVDPGAGDNSFVQRMPDADKTGCSNK